MKPLTGAVGSTPKTSLPHFEPGGGMMSSDAGLAGAGDQAADFSLPSLDGDTVSLSDYRGRKLILFVWASW